MILNILIKFLHNSGCVLQLFYIFSTKQLIVKFHLYLHSHLFLWAFGSSICNQKNCLKIILLLFCLKNISKENIAFDNCFRLIWKLVLFNLKSDN